MSAKSGDPVDSDDIELGYEIRKGRHVTFERGELDDLRPESTKAVEVSDFVALDDIDPIYYERTYWLGTDRQGGGQGLPASACRHGGSPSASGSEVW